MNKKRIKIKFTDFFGTPELHDLNFYQILEENYELCECDDPDYVFSSCFGDEHLKYRDSIKVQFIPESVTPDFNLFDYAIGFDSLTFGDRYIRVPFCYQPYYKKDFERIPFRSPLNGGGKKFCSVVISNGYADSERTRFFDLLNTYKEVSSGGGWRNNVGGRVPDKYEFEKNFKFHICFENSSCPGYITEKIVNAFAAGGVPIYWGAPDIGEMFNTKAFINVLDYPTLEEVVQEVIRLDNDDMAYNAMLSEKVFTDANYWSYENQKERLTAFIKHIIEQPKSEAYRFNRGYCGVPYYIKMRASRDVYNLYKQFKSNPISGIRLLANHMLGKK